MKQSDFNILVEDTIKSTANLLIMKGEEYAGTKDRLSNFKRGAELTGTTPLQTALIYASKHYDSICTYIRKDAAGFQQVLSEPIEGRFDDLINYCILMKAIVAEMQKGNIPSTDKSNNAPGLSNPDSVEYQRAKQKLQDEFYAKLNGKGIEASYSPNKPKVK